jgi:hypothetical protein
MSISAFAGGASDALQEILKQKFLEIVQRQRQEVAMRGLDQEAQRDAANRELGFGRLGLDRENLGLNTRRVSLDESKFGEDKSRYAAEAGDRAADTAYKGALTGEIIRKPTAEQQDREFTTSRDKTLHGYRLNAIGAEGAEQRRSAAARQGSAPEQRDRAEDFGAERQTRMRDAIAAIKPEISRKTAGIGSVLAGIPETGARNLRAKLESLKSNVAFNELQEMRNASKTGGALGQVSDKENAMLAAALGSLDQGQSPEQLSKTLDNIVGILDRWESAKAQYGGAKPMTSRDGSSDGAAAKSRAAELLKKYGG